ncbi:hypothetical protein DIPPA_12273 [Diplonema papillatum]|nr:hypothetical protein DIPPA_12273 [Diplonema papillatum]
MRRKRGARPARRGGCDPQAADGAGGRAEVYYTCGGLTAENVADVFDRLSMRPPPEEVIGADFASVRRKDRAAFLDKQVLRRNSTSPS